MLGSLLLLVKLLLLLLFLIALSKDIALKIIVKHFPLLFAITFDFFKMNNYMRGTKEKKLCSNTRI